MAYPRYPSCVREDLLARIARGERVSHVCREAGMPTHEAVTGWARREPGFGQRYAEAKAKGAYLRRAGYDPEKARVVLERLNGGEAVKAVLVGPHMPSRETYRIWRQQQPDFAEAVFICNREKRAAVAARRRRDSFRHFDQVLADRIVARAAMGTPLRRMKAQNPELPGPRVIARWRRADRDFNTALKIAFRMGQRLERRGRKCNAATLEAIAERVYAGETLMAISRDPAMPCSVTLYGWLRTRREFREAIVAALQARADLLADGVLEIAEEPRGTGARGRRAAALRRKVERLDARAAGLLRG